MKSTCLKIVLFVLLAVSVSAQDNQTQLIPRKSSIPNKQFSIGLGFGIDYGGLGVNLLYYPDPHFGLFGGFGYAFAGAGYNIGMKALLCRDEPKHRTHGFAELMYGYHAAVVVTDYSKFDKLFYGLSPGIGIDIHTRKSPFSFWSLAFLFPIRSGEFENYMDELKNVYHIEFDIEPSPVLFSVGLHF